ncbi:hypothetical protein [Vibrio cholerae]|uniref:hypothetical protein n=1 Tax=Vibrio cholerae TaxID=666 RepID=UPI00301DEDB0
MVTVIAFEFSVMRCQPLRRALYEIKVLYVERLPLPENKSLLFQMQRLGLDSPYFTGTTFGYGIWISNKMKGDKLLIAHELIHVKQMEALGLEEFTKKYLLQLAILVMQKHQ